MEDKLKELVGNSELNLREKMLLNAFIDRATDGNQKRSQDRKLIEQVANEKNLSEVIISTDDVKIYKISGIDEFDIKYPYRLIYLNKEGIWKRAQTVSPDLDVSLLVYLEYKYLGFNGRFAEFAIKMLGMTIEV